ncbi:C6 finger domain protein, putative [Cordyceps militaris CM01]|uniref:C6 finger domain protein, putative n=1 Tax=Cordyceps militaris (strain CM01) TaxID=983644 RepID=G3JTN5_CORMM|nr:C6 finger domain protein, putative [Cordyceps militaris CM01]EGX88039.1 C6 finger domain protein, putative [Cordyceps militaris CM01]
MSNSAIERDNPPPRRKSCTPCIKAKRRCEYPDATTAAAACMRCARRGVMVCDYPHHHRQRTGTTTPQGVTSTLTELAEVRTAQLQDWLTMPPPVDMDIGPLINGVDRSGFEVGGGLADLDHATICGDWEWLPGPYLHAEMATADDYNYVPTLAFFDPGTAVLAPAAQQLAYIAALLRSRLAFAVELMRRAPRTMVARLETPWSHHLLYQQAMPAAMQDALGCCALYLARTGSNAGVVFALLGARVHALLAAAAAAPATLQQTLAHTHALLLYQAMQLFDDDGVLRETWQDWALNESARRTVLVSFYMLQAYRAMTGGVEGQPPRCTALRHAWTLSRALWCARNEGAWEKAWTDGRWWVVTNSRTRWERMTHEAAPQDVDAFGRMWMTALMGVEEAEGWFARKGGVLRERDGDELDTAVVW